MAGEDKARKFQLVGWGLFLVSAFFFIAAGLRSGDMLALGGALFFLIACIVFLVPYFWRGVDGGGI